MASIEERTARGDDYLVALYELSDGDTMKSPTHREIAERSGISEDDIFSVGYVVTDKGHARWRTLSGLDGGVSITSSGIERAEQIISARK
jgi:hypothetical protein